MPDVDEGMSMIGTVVGDLPQVLYTKQLALIAIDPCKNSYSARDRCSQSIHVNRVETQALMWALTFL